MLPFSASQPGFTALLRHVTPHRNVIALAIMLLTLSSCLALVGPWLAGRMTQSALSPTGSEQGPALWLMAWLLLVVVRAVIAGVSDYHLGLTSESMSRALRNTLHMHILALPLACHHEAQRGDMLSTLYNDTDRISSFVIDTMVQVLPALLVFFGATTMLVLLESSIALLVVVLLPLFLLAMKFVGRALRPLARAWRDANARLYQVADQNLYMLPEIKSYTREPLHNDSFRQSTDALYALARRQLLFQSLVGPLSMVATGVGIAGIVWLGSSALARGELSAGDLVSILFYATLMVAPLSQLANVYGQLQLAMGSTERIVELFAAEPEHDCEDAVDLVRRGGAIRFSGVCFAYPGRRNVLSGLDWNVNAGETVAIVGSNGAGKSTLVHLLTRLADPDAGSIAVDDQLLTRLTRNSLRRNIAVVAQQVLLINGSVEENLRIGCEDASAEALAEAVRLARADQFIAELPQGLSTVIGDQGVRLSGGQRQRLALARALLKDAQILVLDEATAMFDPEGEAEFIRASRDLLRHLTVIIITHRPATLALADRVFRLRDGQLVEEDHLRLTGR